MTSRTQFKRSLHVAGVTATFLGVVGLSACGAEGGDAGDSGGTGPIIAIASSNSATCLANIAESYTAETDNKVEVIPEGYPTYRDKLMTSFLAGGSAYDVVAVDTPWTGEFADLGYIKPVEKDLLGERSDQYFPSALGAFNFEDTQYALPLYSYPDVLYYRTDLFEKAGLEPPTSWDEFNAVADFFTDNSDYPGVYGTVLRGSPATSETEFNIRYWNLGGKPLLVGDDPADSIDVDIASEAIELMKTHLNYSPPGAIGWDESEAADTFLEGDAAMAILHTSGVLGGTVDAAGTVTGKVGTAAVPGEGLSPTFAWGLSVATGSTKSKSAIEFIEYATSPEMLLKCAKENGVVPALPKLFEDAAIADTWWADGIQTGLETGIPSLNDVNAIRLRTAINNAASEGLAGQTDAQTSAEKIAHDVERITNED